MRGLWLLAFAASSLFAQQTGLVHTADVDLAFEVYGNAGSPVIVANGGPGLSHVYMIQNDVWKRVANGRTVVFYDQRGTGKSSRLVSNAAQIMDAQVADLEAVRAHFAFAKFALVGDSYGGLLAMAYAAAHPEHVDKLVVSDSAAPAMKDTVHVLQQVFPDMADKRLEDPQQQLINHFRMLFYSEEKRDAYLAPRSPAPAVKPRDIRAFRSPSRSRFPKDPPPARPVTAPQSQFQPGVQLSVHYTGGCPCLPPCVK